MPAKHKPSTSRPALYCHAPLCSSPTALQARSLHHPYLRGTVNTQHGNAKLGGGSMSHLYQGSLLQQPNLFSAAPVFTSGSLDILKRSPSPSRHLKRHRRCPQDKKPSSLTNSRLEDEPGTMTTSKLHPPPGHSSTTSGRDPRDELPTGSRSPLFVCSAQVQSLGSPGTSQFFFAWPFSFAGIRENTAVLSIRKGKMIKLVK